MLVLLLATLAAAVSPDHPAATSDSPKPEAIGNRELGIAIGFGVPTNDRLYVNPFGPTLSARFGWTLGGPTFRYYVGAEGTLTTGVRRSYFTESATAKLFHAGVAVGLRYYLANQPVYVGINLGAGLGRLTYQLGDRNDADNVCLGWSSAVTLGFAITKQIVLGAEAKVTVISWPGAHLDPLLAFTPSVQSTYHF